MAGRNKISLKTLEGLINFYNPENLRDFLVRYGWTPSEYHRAVLDADADFLDSICYFNTNIE